MTITERIPIPDLILTFALMVGCASGSQAPSTDATEASQPTRDVWIATRLEAAYLFNRHLNNFDIQSDVERGNVLLTGTVQSSIDRDLAEEIARSLEGVRTVENHLIVRSTAQNSVQSTEAESTRAEERDLGDKIDDAGTTMLVKTRLVANEHLSGLSIDVTTVDAVVTLTGEVASSEEKQLAGYIAKNTPNVDSVSNRLEIADHAG